MLVAAFIGMQASPARAQDTLSLNVPFAFQAAGALHPAGVYRLSVDTEPDVVALTSAAGEQASIKVLGRMAGSLSSPGPAAVAFEKVGETYYLSEMWIPNLEGYQTYITKEKHSRHMVHAKVEPN